MAEPWLEFQAPESEGPWSEFAKSPAPAAEAPGLVGRLKQGLNSTLNYGRINLTDNPDEIAGYVADTERNRPAATPAQQKMQEEIQPYAQKAKDAEGFVPNVEAYGKLAAKRAGQLVSNPSEFAGMVAENLPNSVPGIAAGLAGGAVGGMAPVPGGALIGGLVGGTAGGYQVEQGSSMHDQIVKEAQSRGVPLTDTKALSGIIAEKYPEFLQTSRLKGVGTAGTDAAINALTLGVAGAGERAIAKEAQGLAALAKTGGISATDYAAQVAALEAKNAARNTLGQKVLRGTGVTLGEMGGESVSEGVGQQLAYGQLDPLDVVDEGLLAVGQGAATAGARKVISPILGIGEKGGAEAAIEQAKNTVPAPAIPDPSTGGTFTPDPNGGVLERGLSAMATAQAEVDALAPRAIDTIDRGLDLVAPPTAPGFIPDSELPIVGQPAPEPVEPQRIVSGNEPSTTTRGTYGDALAKQQKGELLTAADVTALKFPPDDVEILKEPSRTKKNQSIEPVKQIDGMALPSAEKLQGQEQPADDVAPAIIVEPNKTADPVVESPQDAEKKRIAEVVSRLQNRNRSSAASAAQMAKIASNPDPDLLMASPTMSDGAPVASDLSVSGVVPEAQQGRTANVSTAKRKIPVRYAVVEASSISASNFADGSRDEAYATDPGKLVAINNGRTAGLLEAYRRGTAGQYRAVIEEGQDTHGIPKEIIAGMNAPVLVRLIASADVTENIGDESNAGMTLGLSATEQAKNDASRLDMTGIEYDEDGHALPQSVRMFIAAMSESEQQTLAPNGEPTKQAIDRLTAATFHAAYENSELVGLMAEATDPDAVNILRAMSKAAASMAKLKDAGDLDIRSVVVGAAMKVVNAARSGVSMKKFLAQGDMFDTSFEKRVADMFATNARSPKKIAEALVNAADFAYAESIRDVNDMFGDSVPRASREEVLKRAERDTTSEEDLGQQGRRRPGNGNDGNVQNDAGNAGDARQNQVNQPSQDYDTGDLLASYDKQDLEEKEARIKAAEKETAKLEAELERKAKIDALMNRKTGVAKKPKAVQDDIFNGNMSLFSRASKYGTEIRTLDLFTSQIPTRPGEDTAASRADRLGLSSTTLLRGAKGSLLGLAISADWIRGKGSELIGKRVTSAADLATLGAVLRDPRTETFRYFLMKGDQIVYHTAVSSRMESSSAAFVGRPESFLLGISDTMERLGADGYYLMHNHPSRLVEASEADRRMTAYIDDMLPGFRGHVILDHTEFGLLRPNKFGMVMDKGAQPLKATGQDPTRSAKLPHAALDSVVSSPKMLAALAHEIRSPSNVIMVSADAQNHVTGIMEVSADDMKKGTLTAVKNIMRLRKATGSNTMFAILPKGMALSELSKAITSKGLLLDASAIGIRYSENGAHEVSESAAEKGMLTGRRPLGRDRTGIVDSPRQSYGTGDLFANMQTAEREEIAAAQRKNSPQVDMFAAMDRAERALPAADNPATQKRPVAPESDQDRSWREYAENYSAVTGDIQGSIDKNILRAIGYASKAIGSYQPRAFAGDEAAKSMIDSLNREIDGLKQELDRRKPTPAIQKSEQTTATPVAESKAQALPDGATQEDADWVKSLFSPVQDANNEPAASAQKSAFSEDAVAGIKSKIAATIAGLQKEKADWIAKEYKKNSKQVELKGDGPSNRASLSVGGINENRRRKAIAQIDSDIQGLKKFARLLEDNPTDAIGKVGKAVDASKQQGFIDNWSGLKDGKGNRVILSADDMAQMMIAYDLFDDKYYGRTQASSAVLKAYQESAPVAEKPQSEPTKALKPVDSDRNELELIDAPKAGFMTSDASMITARDKEGTLWYRVGDYPGRGESEYAKVPKSKVIPLAGQNPLRSTPRASEQLFTEDAPVSTDQPTQAPAAAGASSTTQGTTNDPTTTETQQAEAKRQEEQPAAPVARPAALPNHPAAKILAKALPEAKDVQIHSTDSLSSEKESGATGRMSKWRGKTIERLAKVFGRKRVVFFSSSSPAGTTTNGMTYGADGVLYINIDAGVDPLAVVGHEWRHTLRYSNAAAHAAINQAATKLLDQPGRLLEFAKVYHGVELAQEDGGSKETKDLIARIEAGEATAREKARLAEEFSADMTGNLWRDPKALKEVFDTILEQHPPSAARTIIKSIGDAIIKLINKLIISTPKGQYSEMGISREELLGLKKEIQAAMADSFRQDVQQRMGKALGVKRSTPREDDRRLAGTKVVDENGTPMLVYHSGKEKIERFDAAKTVGGGFHFGTYEQAKMRGGKRGETFVARLAISNPRRSKDMGGNWKAKITSAKAGGHDGIVYLNRYEGVTAERIKALSESGQLNKLDQLSDAEFRRVVPEARDSYIAFRPEQIIAATGNAGAFSEENPDIRFSPPRFFSHLATSIDQIPKKMETMPAAQWRMWLTGNAPKLGIKKDEIVWSGIEDYLEMRGKDKVTKAEVQQFLSENGTQVNDVVLGVEPKEGARLREINKELETATGRRREALVLEHAELGEKFRDGLTQPKFGQYVVPGGENYRELLITLPGKSELNVVPHPTKGGFAIQYGNGAYVTSPDGGATTAQTFDPDKASQWDKKEYISAGLRSHDKAQFYSSHFDQPNILAHLRMDERTDAQGDKVLFLEELQSDFGQQGEKLGFVGQKPDDESKLVELKAKLANETDADKRAALGKSIAKIDKRISGDDYSVPQAPIVTDTKSWVALGLKRAIMYAVQNGMSKVAWASGEQNAAHYDLSKQVEEIEATPNGDGTYDLVMTLLDGGTQRMNNVAEGKLDDSIGKELAEKIVNDSARWTAANKAYRDELKKTYIPEERLDELRDARDEIELTYSGLDLKVGGEGMRAFYDQIVPQVANDVLKKLGGGKVETIEIDTRSPEDNSYYETPKDSDFMPQQGFTIPQIMVEKVQTEGVPLFSPPRYEVKRDEEDEGTFAVALSNDQKNRNGDPLQVAHLHVPDEAVSAAGWRIGDIQVTKALRRQGIASELVRRMSKHLGSKPIGAASVFSEDGKKFFENAKFSPARAQTETPEFKKWFGDSKVVDAEGKPLVVYHGTVGDHNVFDESTRGQYTREDQGAQSGFFFTASRSMAEWFAERAYERRGTRDSEGNERPYDARVIEVYLKAENPYIPTDEEGNYKSIRHAESNGHDSVYLPDGDDVNPEETWIVLSNKQIKSATGNNGQFDPTNPDIRRSTPRGAITNQPINQSWQDPDNMGKWDDFVRTMADKMWDTKKVLAAIRAAGIAIKDTIDPYLQEVLYHGRAAKRVSDFADNELRPMLVEMGARKIERQELEDYLWARHATERNAQIAKINPKMPDGGSGLTNQQAADILSGQTVNIGGRDIKLNLAQMPGYRSLAAKIDAITKETTDTLVRYGLETQDTVDAWRNTYGKYVPLMRDMEADDNYAGAFNLGLGTGQGFSVRGSASKRALGSERGVIDILANVAMQRERAIVRGEKNRVAQSMYGLAITAPNPDFWLPLNPDAKKDPAQVTAELVALGLNPIDAANIANEPKQRYTDPNTGMVMERISPQLRSRGDVLAVRINGKDRYVMFSSNERAQKMVAGLKNLDVDQLGMVMQKMAVVTRWFAAINTQYNPVFGLTNGIRDLGTGMLNLTSTELKGHQAEVFKNAFSALRGVYADLRDHRAGRAPTSKWALEFEEFALEGGQTGYRDMFQTSRDRTEGLMQELKDATKGKTLLTFSEKRSPLFGWLSDYNTSIENAIRLSAYKAAKDKGMTKAQAASLAKNLTVNFNKKGLAATQLGAMYAFFNAAAQGTARIGQTLVKVDNGKFSLTGAGKKIVYGGMMAGVLQAAMFAAAGWDDEEPPQFIREKNFIIPVPVGTPGASEHKGKDGKVRYYLSVPYPLGYHVLPGVGRISTEFALGGFKNPGKRLVDMFSMIMDGFNPIGGSSGGVSQMLSPTVTDPLVALSENKDWTGKSIYKEDFNSMHPTAGWTRKKDTASNLSRWLAYGINYLTGGGKYEIGLLSPTPDQLDYLIGQATGGVGRESLKAWQFGATAATGENMPMYKVPIAGRFVGETTGQASETSKFYNNLKRIGEHKAALDEMQKARDLSAMIEYRKENPDAALVKQADKASTDISELKRRKRELLEKGSSPEQIKLMEAVITTRVKRYNEMLSARS
jgi:hypothetical protein